MNTTLQTLLDLGDPGGRGRWRDYLSLDFGPDAEDDLIAIVRNPALVWAEVGSNESWAALHAWRALGQLRSVRAIPALEALLDDVEGDDWLMEDLPRVFGLIGVDAVPALSAYLADTSKGTFPRGIASSALLTIAQAYSEARDASVRSQMAALESFDEQDPLLNAMLTGDLMDLHAIEAASLIERAFQAEMIDPRHVGDWEDVQVGLGLLPERITPRARPGLGVKPSFERAREDREAREKERRKAEVKKKARAKQRRKAARKSRRRTR